MSAAMVKVWNDNDYELKERYKGEEITIKPKQYIEMDLFEAHQFKGQYHPQPVDVDGRLLNDPKYYKMIRIERASEKLAAAAVELHKCMQCKHSSPSPEELEAHVKVRHAEAPRLEMPELDVKPSKKA